MSDSEKLAELISEIQYMGGLESRLAEHLIANGVTIQKWIPVTERLPEEDLPEDSKKKVIKCLVAYQTSMGVWVVRTNTRQKGRWYNDKGWDWAVSNNITHWMPLPNPPMEE